MEAVTGVEAVATIGQPPEAPQATDWAEVDADLSVVEGDLEVLEEPVVEKEAIVEATAPAEETAAPAPVYGAPVVAVAPPTAEEKAAAERNELERLVALYKLSDEDATKMYTEPGEVLPKLLAKMHQQAAKDVLDSMQKVVPSIVESNERVSRVETEARTAFFSVNDDLAKPEYEGMVLKVGKMFRELNPSASKEEAVVKIGEMTRVALGLPGKSSAKAPEVVPVVVPFTPSRGGTGGSIPAPKNMWSELNSEFDKDDY